MLECARSGCLNAGTNRCSGCFREPYCCGECQKKDWQPHKKICKVVKKMSNHLQPYHEVIQVIKEIQTSANFNDRRIVKHLLSYAEFQFGDRVHGRDYRERGDVECIDNYTVEVIKLINICIGLTNIFCRDTSLSILQLSDIVLPYREKIMDLLKPWIACLDLGDPSQVLGLNTGIYIHVNTSIHIYLYAYTYTHTYL
jgi:hypothetical protein